MGTKLDAKSDINKDTKKDAIADVLQNCTPILGLVPYYSPLLKKITLKFNAKCSTNSSFCCSDRIGTLPSH